MRKDLLIVNLVLGMRDLLTDNFPGTETVSFIFLPGPAVKLEDQYLVTY